MASASIHTTKLSNDCSRMACLRMIGQHWKAVVPFWILLGIMTFMILPFGYFSKTEEFKLPSEMVSTRKDNDIHTTTDIGTMSLKNPKDDGTAVLNASGIDSTFRVLDINYEHVRAKSSSFDNTDDDDEVPIEPYTYSPDNNMNEIDDIVDKVIGPNTGYKKVLVTGGAGFIGSHIAKALLDRGDDVVIIDEMNNYYDVQIKRDSLFMLQEQYDDDRLKVYYGDVCNITLMRQIFEIEKPRWICHMAARAGVRKSISDPFVYIHSNIEGTTRLLDLTAQYGGVINFVLASSSSVYGDLDAESFSEFIQVDKPLSPYAATKKACELIAYTYHHLYNINITALRFFTVYGPRGRPDMAPYKFIESISKGSTIQQYGDGSSIRDYTFIDDIVDGVLRSLDRPYPYEIINLGNNNGTSLKEFISLVEHHTGRKAMIDIVGEKPGDVPYTQADIRKANKLLGYLPKVSIQEGIERTVRWYQSTFGISGDE
jgi:UDP-glucuronate 4-epimerase